MTKNLSLLDNNQIEEYLTNNSLKIGVIGIGRIGLPTALCFANSGFETIGIDINAELVTMVNSGDYPLKDEPEFDEIFKNVHSQKKLVATTDISKAVLECDIILLSLPTPMNEKNIPDYTALLSVGKSLNKLLSNGQIVIVESTVEPGFIENELLHTIEGSNHTLNDGRLITPEDITAIPAIIAPPKSARPLRNWFFLIILLIVTQATRNAVHPIKKNPFRPKINKMPVPLLSAAAVISPYNIFTKRNTDVKITETNMMNLLSLPINGNARKKNPIGNMKNWTPPHEARPNASTIPPPTIFATDTFPLSDFIALRSK